VGECASNNRDALNFDHHLRARKAGDGDRRACRKIFAENFRAQFGHARGVARVDEKDRHGDQIGELGTGLGQRLLDVAEALAHLRVEIAGERLSRIVHRAGVAGDPDDLARPLGDDGRRVGTLGLPGAAHERFLHRVLPRHARLYAGIHVFATGD
jgi:hypothetical protein